MGFDSRANAKRYTPQDGDTLQAIAERETDAGNPLTWQEIAWFNWGTDDPNEVNTFLRDELGARRRDADNNFVISADDESAAQLLIPIRFRRTSLTLGKTYRLTVRKTVTPRQFLECCHIPGITFAFNSSFIRPDVVGYLKKLEAVARRHPDAKIMIFGHTDAVGDDLYNKKLSERRAWSVYSFITNDPDAWEVLYNHGDEDWGLAVVQEILADLGYDPGAPDGDWGPQTRAAIRSFLGLPEDAFVQNDAAFRKELFATYMASKHDIDLLPERFMEPGYMGCGEYNPIAEPKSEAEKNRRVTFYFLDPEREPTLPCAFADIGPCKKQMVSLDVRHRPTFRCSFYDSWAQRCSGIALLETLFVYYHVPSELEPHWAAPSEWYELTSQDGTYRQVRKAASAKRVDDRRWALTFDAIPSSGRFTLVRHFHETSEFVLFENATLDEIEETCTGGTCKEAAEEVESMGDTDGNEGPSSLTPDEIELFGEFDPDLFALRCAESTDEMTDPGTCKV